MYHFTIGGIPACESPLTSDPKVSTRCSHSSREGVLADIEKVRALYPDAKYVVVEGGCTVPDMYELERRSGFEEGAAAVLAELRSHSISLATVIQTMLINSGTLKNHEKEELDRQRYDEEYERQLKLVEVHNGKNSS